ncbi:MAG: hypothetical protein H6577_00085 [Lewinellaceae bacterium]|nr:hypothetical protein [Saprospiraceae bacterium]MCB9336509.1 hypothetical protein [Lewinellaceae bacterium]
MEEDKEKSSRNPFIAILIFIVLFVMPAGALYFLNAGKNFREEYMEELGNLGRMAPFQYDNQDNLPISQEVMKGRVSVVNFLTGNPADDKAKSERIAKVHQSFDDTEDVLFLSFIPVDSSASLRDEASRLVITDNKQWYLVGTPKGDWERLAKENFKMTDPANEVALVDTTLTIRNIYKINEDESMGKLVVHVSMVIPKQKKRTGF